MPLLIGMSLLITLAGIRNQEPGIGCTRQAEPPPIALHGGGLWVEVSSEKWTKP